MAPLWAAVSLHGLWENATGVLQDSFFERKAHRPNWAAHQHRRRAEGHTPYFFFIFLFFFPSFIYLFYLFTYLLLPDQSYFYSLSSDRQELRMGRQKSLAICTQNNCDLLMSLDEYGCCTPGQGLCSCPSCSPARDRSPRPSLALSPPEWKGKPPAPKQCRNFALKVILLLPETSGVEVGMGGCAGRGRKGFDSGTSPGFFPDVPMALSSHLSF